MLFGLSTLPNLPILLLSRITTLKVDFLLKKVEFMSKKSRNSIKVEFLSKKSRNSTKVEFLIFFSTENSTFYYFTSIHVKRLTYSTDRD